MSAKASLASTIGVLGLLAAVGGCGSSDQRIVVFAASSLTDVFDRLEAEFESANPGVDVVISYGGSASLVAQLADGAPVDVLATADLVTMQRAGVSDATVFAHNEIVIAVEAGNPTEIGALADIADDRVVVLASPEVPAGAYARDVLACAGVDVDPASFEQSVRSAASKVALGEADAALVYRTDIGDDLDSVDVPGQCQVVAQYPIAAVDDGELAGDFVDYVSGPSAVTVLTDAGFVVP